MTDEQIKRNAKAYAVIETACNSCQRYCERGFIAGAHSRDEEIEKLKEELIGLRSEKVQIASGEIGKLQEDVAFYKAQYNATKKELDKLRDPWISVEDRLPERMTSRDSNGAKIIDCCSKDVFGYDTSYKIGRLVCYNHESEMWESRDAYTIGEITHWMPTQIPQKGGEK